MSQLYDFEEIEMYDSEQYYTDIFNAVTEDIISYRDEKYNAETSNTGKGEAFFHVADDDFNSFEKLINAERGSIRRAVEIIVRELLKRNKVTIHPPEAHLDKAGRKCNYLSLSYEKRPNNKTGLKFIWNVQQLQGFKYFENKVNELDLKSEVDELEVVVLERKYQDKSIDSENTFLNKKNHYSEPELDRFNKLAQEHMPGFLKFIPLDDFFIQHFGKEEFLIFDKAAGIFNKKKESVVGYKTFFMPNETEVEKFVNERIAELKEFDYKHELIDTIHQLRQKKELRYQDYNNLLQNIDVQFERCFKRYLSDLRFLIMTGNMDHSESYISSEWYYYSSFETDILDKTAIAVGYIKSAEQLLYQILRTHINGSYEIQHGKMRNNTTTRALKNDKDQYPKCIPFIETYEEYFDTTFGSLNTFVNTYRDSLFEKDTSDEWRTFIVKFLFDYCKKDRNGYLHKDNIYLSSDIKNIRHRTILLYFLLLGSFQLSERDQRLLGGDIAYRKADMIAEMFLGFYKWMGSKLQKCNSSTSTIVLTTSYDNSQDRIVLLQFIETDSFDQINYHKYHEEANYETDVFVFDLGKYTSEKDKDTFLAGMIERYLDINKQISDYINNHEFDLENNSGEKDKGSFLEELATRYLDIDDILFCDCDNHKYYLLLLEDGYRIIQ